MSTCHGIPFAFAELRKPKSVIIEVWIDSFVSMNGSDWKGDNCARRNCHAVGKCERGQCKMNCDHWKDGCAHQKSVFGAQKKEFNEQEDRPSSRWDSRRKLSILCILSIPAFVHVQPSSVITVSTSSRRGLIYSGFASQYNTCVSVY